VDFLLNSPAAISYFNRDAMGFRMLLGRQAVRRRFLIDSGRSFLGSETIAIKP